MDNIFKDTTNYEWNTAIEKEDFDCLVEEANSLSNKYIVPLSESELIKEREITCNTSIKVCNHIRSINALHDIIDLLENNEIQELLVDFNHLLNNETPKTQWVRYPHTLNKLFNVSPLIHTDMAIRKYYTVLYNTLNRLYAFKTVKTWCDEFKYNPLLPVSKGKSYYFSKEEKAYLKAMESEE